MLFTGNHLTINRLTTEGWEKLYHKNTNHKKLECLY